MFYLIFQIFFLKLPKHVMKKTLVGGAVTFFGLAIFLTAVNVGFMPVGIYIGGAISSLENNRADPDRHGGRVLYRRRGAGRARAQRAGGGRLRRLHLPESDDDLDDDRDVSISVGLAMIRAHRHLHLVSDHSWLHAAAFHHALSSPPHRRTAVASWYRRPCDVSSVRGMACSGRRRRHHDGRLGVVAMVAMTPLVTIQILEPSTRSKKSSDARGDPAYGDAQELERKEEEIIDF